MTKFIWMSDPHFQTVGTIDGLNPRVRLSAAFDHANTHHSDAAFIVLSGDLVGDDIAADYPAIAQYLSQSQLSVHAMMGNNDSRDGFRQNLSLPDSAMPAFIQYTLPIDEGVLICLDTHKLGSHAGQLCESRLAWLDAQLSASADKDAYIVMHHPPMPLGLPAQDEIMLDDGDAFFELIGGHANVRHLFMGHVHRTTSGVINEIPFASLGALSFQAPAPRPAWHWDTFKPPQEAPKYAVVHVDAGNVTIQYTQFCDYALGVEA